MYFRYGDPSWETAERPKAGANGNDQPNGNGHADGHANGDRQPTGRFAHVAGTSLGGTRFPTVDLRGVQVHAVTEADVVQHILCELDARRGGMVVTPNLDHLYRCLHDHAFAALVSEADLVVADGMPLVWAARLQGTPLPQRVAGSNLISSLSGAAAVRGRSVFLLGGAPGTAERAAQVLRERFPALNVAGTACPPIGFENDPAKMADLIAAVSGARPDIIYVALGSPKQERLIVRLRPLLPQAWWLGVGISFSFLSGDVRRAPLWMQKTGLEWLHRLVQEPKRLFRRYIVVGVPFASGLLAKAAAARVSAALVGGGRRAAVAPRADMGPPQRTASAAGAPAAVAPRIVVDTPPFPEAAAVAPGSAKPQAVSLGSPALGKSLYRLRAMVLLGGSVRPTALGLATGRSVLDLPLDRTGSVLTGWLDQAEELAAAIGLPRLPVRVMVNHTSPEPTTADPRHFGKFRVERDLSEYRGTGGVLRDLASDYADDDLILVANAAQILLDPLPSIVSALERTGGDVTVVSHEDGTPSGIMLVTCKTLRGIAETGYVDMKEQALPQIASKFDVRVLARRRPTGIPIRTLEDYIQGLRFHHRRQAAKLDPAAAGAMPGCAASTVDPLAEDWNPLFSLTESGAAVDPTARVHDSVVLAGGVVDAGAVLVRSVVCPGGVLRRDRTAMETFVTARDAGSETAGRKARGLGAIGAAKPAAVTAAPAKAVS